MDTAILVNPRIEDGQKLLQLIADDGVEVSVAAWLKPNENSSWVLLIGSDLFDPNKFREFFGRILACLLRIPDPAFTISEVKLVHTSNLIAQDLIALRKKYATGNLPIRYAGWKEQKLDVDDAYIYPLVKKKSADENSLIVDAVTELSLENGNLKIAKSTFRIPKHGPLPQPKQSWITDAKMKDGELIVTKVNFTQGPEGLQASYTDEVASECAP